MKQNWKIHVVCLDNLEGTLNEVDGSKNFGVANIIPPMGMNDQWTVVARRIEEQPPMPQEQQLPPEVQAALQKKMAEQNA